MKYGIKVIYSNRPPMDERKRPFCQQTHRGWEIWCNSGIKDGKLNTAQYTYLDINMAYNKASRFANDHPRFQICGRGERRMRYSITSINPTFTFSVYGEWVKTQRGIEKPRWGNGCHYDINEAYKALAQATKHDTAELYYIVEEEP